MAQDLCEIGEIPPIGEVPERMYAQVIRPERYGEPEEAFQVEAIEVAEPGPRDDLVLVMAAGINYNNVWAARGGAGGLGSMAIQIVQEFGGRAVALVSSESKAEFCRKLGAVGVVNRREFDHWGMLPHWTDNEAFGTWLEGAKRFGKAFWDALGE